MSRSQSSTAAWSRRERPSRRRAHLRAWLPMDSSSSCRTPQLRLIPYSTTIWRGRTLITNTSQVLMCRHPQSKICSFYSIWVWLNPSTGISLGRMLLNASTTRWNCFTQLDFSPTRRSSPKRTSQSSVYHPYSLPFWVAILDSRLKAQLTIMNASWWWKLTLKSTPTHPTPCISTFSTCSWE